MLLTLARVTDCLFNPVFICGLENECLLFCGNSQIFRKMQFDVAAVNVRPKTTELSAA